MKTKKEARNASQLERKIKQTYINLVISMIIEGNIRVKKVKRGSFQ